MPATKSPAKPGAKTTKNIWSKEERDAVAAAARERKTAAGRTPAEERAAGLQDLNASLAKMPDDDRAMGERIHEIISTAVPDLVPKTYYGMPAWATPGKDGKTICFYKPKSKFRVRYSNLGFQADARLDDGKMWATEFAVIELTPEVERRIGALVKQAVG